MNELISMDKEYTKGGDPVRILCIDRKGDYPVVVLINDKNNIEPIQTFTAEGSFVRDEVNPAKDLIEVKKWDQFKIDDPVMVRTNSEHWSKRYFAGVDEGKPTTFLSGATSWSKEGGICYWRECRKPTEEEL